MKHAFIAALAALALIMIVSAEMELREDFSGEGEFQARSDLNGIQDRASTRGGSLVYGHILAQNESFSGFEALGDCSYIVSSEDHYLSIREASGINATARMSRTLSELEEERFSLFAAQGNGTVREAAKTGGDKGRMVELSSIFHQGPFRLNSSTRISCAAPATGDTS
ncbi:Uncharacterised protein [uncultured archaeon]|nr:Uncharacterised protein [uncultured archaeon]